MYLLVETIKIIDGIPQNLSWHQKRFENSYHSLFYQPVEIKLNQIIVVPDKFRTGKVKARFLYNKETYTVEFQKYSPVIVQSLKIVENDKIEYKHKFVERNRIIEMKAHREDCDDILIVRNGRITDSSIANIVLYDGKNWVTPEFPLLEGTARERLLHTGRIISKDIKLDNIKMFSHFRLVNSMLDFDEQEMIGISALK